MRRRWRAAGDSQALTQSVEEYGEYMIATESTENTDPRSPAPGNCVPPHPPTKGEGENRFLGGGVGVRGFRGFRGYNT